MNNPCIIPVAREEEVEDGRWESMVSVFNALSSVCLGTYDLWRSRSLEIIEV